MNWQDKVKEIYNSLKDYTYAVIYSGSYTLPWIKNAHDIDIGIIFEDAEKQQKGIQIFNSLYNRQDLKKDYQLCIHFSEKDNRYGTLFQYEYNFNETLCGEKIEKINIFLDNKIKQLKQSQKQLAISELEKLKDFFLEPYEDEKMGTEFLITTKNTGKIAEFVLDRIKSLKGE